MPGALELAQDLTANQNWTLVGILGTVLVATVGLLVWIVRWLCGRFTSSIDAFGATTTAGTKAMVEVSAASTKAMVETSAHLEALATSHATLKGAIGELIERVDSLVATTPAGPQLLPPQRKRPIL